MYAQRIEDAGLTFTGIQSLPYSLYGDIMFNREGLTAGDTRPAASLSAISVASSTVSTRSSDDPDREVMIATAAERWSERDRKADDDFGELSQPICGWIR